MCLPVPLPVIAAWAVLYVIGGAIVRVRNGAFGNRIALVLSVVGYPFVAVAAFIGWLLRRMIRYLLANHPDYGTDTTTTRTANRQPRSRNEHTAGSTSGTGGLGELFDDDTDSHAPSRSDTDRSALEGLSMAQRSYYQRLRYEQDAADRLDRDTGSVHDRDIPG